MHGRHRCAITMRREGGLGTVQETGMREGGEWLVSFVVGFSLGHKRVVWCWH